MQEKITSIRIDEELWKKAKILAIKRGMVLKKLVEEILSSEVEADEWTKGLKFSQEFMNELKDARGKGNVPFRISSRKSSVELVKEGRGE